MRSVSQTMPRSRFGPPINVDQYLEQFLSPEEGAPRAAVKRLTAAIEQQLIEATINAPDWCVTLFCLRSPYFTRVISGILYMLRGWLEIYCGTTRNPSV